MAVPIKTSALVNWSTNFEQRVSASPVTYGYTAAQATQYTTLHDALIAANSAVVAAEESGTRSSPLIATRNAAKAALLPFARELYAQCQASLTVPDAAKIEIGITVRQQPSTQPVPADEPAIDVLSGVQNTVKLRLHDSTDPARRGKPALVDGAAIFSFVGEEPPTPEQGWRFENNTTRTRVDIQFPATVAPGSKVWFTAFWFNEKKQAGPAAAAVSTRLQGGSAMAA